MRKIFLALFIIVALFVIFSPSEKTHELFGETTLFVSIYVSQHPILGLAVFTIFSAASAVLSPLSAVPIVPFAVSAWGSLSVFLLLIFSWTIGAIFSYAVGKYGIYVFLKKLTPFKKVEEYQKKIPSDSEFFLVVLFRLALPSEVSGLVLGSLKYDFYRYMAATIISEIPFALFAVYLGKAVVFDDPLQFLVWLTVGALFLAIIIPIFLATVKIKKLGLPQK